MPDPLAVHFTTSPPDARHQLAGPGGVSAAIMLACAPELGLVDAAEWKHTGDPSDANCAACIASPAWLEAAVPVIAERLPADRPVYMWPLRGRHRRPDEAMILTAAGRGVLTDRRVRVLEELAVAAWSLALAPPMPVPPAPGSDDSTPDRVLDELRLRAFVSDEIAAILRRRPDLATRYDPGDHTAVDPLADLRAEDGHVPDHRRAEADRRLRRLYNWPHAADLAPAAHPPAGDLAGTIPGIGRAYDDPYGYPSDPALD